MDSSSTPPAAHETVAGEDLAFTLWTTLDTTRDMLYRLREKELLNYNVSVRQSMVLLSIDTLPGEVTPGRIAEWLNRDRSTITGIINRMEKDGLITKSPDRKIKTRVIISMTDNGRNVYRRALHRELIHRAVADFSTEELAHFKFYLQRLRSSAARILKE